MTKFQHATQHWNSNMEANEMTTNNMTWVKIPTAMWRPFKIARWKGLKFWQGTWIPSSSPLIGPLEHSVPGQSHIFWALLCFHFFQRMPQWQVHVKKTNTTVLKNVLKANIETNIQHKHKLKNTTIRIYCRRKLTIALILIRWIEQKTALKVLWWAFF